MLAAQIEDGVVVNVIVVDDLDVLPSLVDGANAKIGDTWDGNTFHTPSQHVDLPALKKALADGVDTAIAAIYNRWLRFDAEYSAREAAAREYKLAAYEGDPGLWVTAFATNAGLSDIVATDTIIEQADALREALRSLGALRMAKYGIQGAASAADAQAVHDSIIEQANTIASAL